MNRDKLKSILQSSYKREDWRNVLSFLSGNKDLLKQRLEPKEIELHTQKASKIVKKLYELGTLTTADGVQLPIFEIELQENIKIEYNKVGVNQLIKDYILKDAGKGAIATYHYADEKLKEWRFSFISKFGGSEFFKEVEDVETNPKKYTYIFGTPEEHRTALERFYNLEHSQFTLDDFFEAFNVEPVSNNFFKEYKNFYLDFVNHLSEDEKCRQIFEAENSEDVDKDIRNFVKRLLGRIVFLYFLQKKQWLGASNLNYDDGDTNFLLHLFEANKEQFYEKWLSKLFFNALNTPDRPDDNFEMPNGQNRCIPFLNGGLFEESQEPEQHKYLHFPDYLFEELFTFFNGYNFTIYENSPEDHTVAVDPEMLGNIFENLLEDNRDKGTFYTPKEIVHYMTQESIIEYLSTHLNDKSKLQLENLVRNQVIDNISRDDLTAIEELIDKVKICDPAIGSGAFPMGMLQEIFNLKAFIHYELGYEIWSPAKIKQDIIQNSIYGVDLETDAIDISRLRFWLSLVVDENKPKPLPNLDYKIMQGNSLMESYNGIDLSNVSSGKNLKITEAQKDLFGNLKEEQMNLTFDKVGIAEELSKRTEEYFTASAENKPILKQEIDELVNEFILYNIELRENQLIRRINEQKEQKNTLSKKRQNQLNAWQKRLENLSDSKNSLLNPQQKESDYFLWHLFFKDVFDGGGFDIVIGNPPYGVSIKGSYREEVLKAFGKVPDYEIYYFFTELAFKLVKEKGIKSFIIPNTFLFNTFADLYRRNLLQKWQLIEILDCTKFSIFQTATVRNVITLWKKDVGENVGYKQTKNKKTFKQLSSSPRQNIKNVELLQLNQNWGLAFFLDKQAIKRVARIKTGKSKLENFYPEISQGLIAYDKYRGQSKEIIKSRAYHYTKYEKEGLKKWLWGADVTRYKVEWNKVEYIDYCEGIANPRDPKYFKGERLLVREITNPSVFAGITDEELYNDPAIIIIKSNQDSSVKPLSAIINSKLATYYHFNNSPKATKGAFPKILVKDVREFPLPENFNKIEVLNYLVDIIILIKNSKNIIFDPVPNLHIAETFEEVIDALVFELYFSEEFSEKKIEIKKHTKTLFKKIEGLSEKEQIKSIQEIYQTLREKDNPLRNQIKLMKIELKDLLLPILSV
jgi:hypothetical protein